MNAETGHHGGIPFVRFGDGGETIVVISGGDAFVRRFDAATAARRAERIVRLFPAGNTICILGYDVSAQCDAAAIASSIARVIRENFSSVTLAGISFGGLVATRVAAAHPELVRNLILLSTAHRFSDEGRRRVRQQMADAARGDFVAMAKPFLVLFRRPWLNAMLRLAIWSRRHKLAATMNDPRFIVCMLEAALAAGEGGREHLRRITARTLLVAGTHDQFFDETAVRETADSIPQAQLVLFPKETHMLPLERPPLVTNAVATFLRSGF
ncbi:MAG: alpha/beta hydrolase [Acidobacteriota bacterium]|nr:alpha/beta hydrolase [Acidobacteriota bacterium]